MSAAAPAVTVFIPAFNARAYIGRAIKSVLRQTFTDFELLVVDDGSTDGSADVVQAFADPRIRLLRNRRNEGRVRAANQGLAAARAPVVARLDADDLAMPTRLERQARFLADNPTIALVGSWAVFVDDSDRPFLTAKCPTRPGQIYEALLRTNCIHHSCATFRRDAVLGAGGYRDRFDGLAEDYDLWLRLAERHGLANLPEVLGGYRVHAVQVSQVKYAPQRAAGNAIRHAAALERHRLGRLADPAPFAPPRLLASLRGARNTVAADCIGWSRVYRSMDRPDLAARFALRACLHGPLAGQAWRALAGSTVQRLLPGVARRRLAWYSARLRAAASAEAEHRRPG